MPRSKSRKPHHQQHAGSDLHRSGHDKKSSAVTVTIIFFAIIGLAIAYFIAGANFVWLAIGTIIGAIGGYFFGKQLDRSFSKK